jgi:hypothetical protein
MTKLPKLIVLFGHRQEHGKDTCGKLLKNYLNSINISNSRHSFAKLLKKQVAERYNLDADKMDDAEYKKQLVPWASPNPDGSVRTVRDLLLLEGCHGRSLWEDTWAWSAYEESLKSGNEVCYLTDYRFPNEKESFDRLFELYVSTNLNNKLENAIKPVIVSIQVYRESGVFKNDGADAELPDDFEKWDYNIINKDTSDWLELLDFQVKEIFNSVWREICHGNL